MCDVFDGSQPMAKEAMSVGCKGSMWLRYVLQLSFPGCDLLMNNLADKVLHAKGSTKLSLA